MATVNVTRLAEALNLDERRVQQLVKEGMPKVARGQYDPIRCMWWYVRFLQRGLEKKSVPTLDGGFVGERYARIRLLRADADLREMKLAEKRGQLITLELHKEELADLYTTTKAHIVAIAVRLAPELVGETSRLMVQAKLDKACREALSALAKSAARHPREPNSPAKRKAR